MKKWWIIPVLITGSLRAQQLSTAHFTNYSLQQGLSSASVNCLYQDKRGFVWIGTADGLDLFDGLEFTVFRHNRYDSTSLCDNDVRSIVEDEQGMLWVGTRDGVSRLDPVSKKSRTYVKGQKGRGVFNDAFICKTWVDAQGHVWAYSQNTIALFSEKDDHFNTFFSVKKFDASLARIHSFFIDSKGRYWVGTESSLCEISAQGTIIKDHATGTFELVSSLREDKWGRIWCGSWGGGFGCFDPATGEFHTCKLIEDPPNPSVDNIVRDVLITKENVLWISSNRGVYRLALDESTVPSLGTLQLYLHNESDAHSLASDFAICLMQERSGDLWVGTGNGLSVLYRKNQVFIPIPSVKGSIPQLLFDTAEVWSAAWYGEGLVRYDRNFTKLDIFPYLPPGDRSPTTTNVSGLCKAADGSLWVASFNGLLHYDPVSKKFEVFKHDTNNGNSIASNRLNDVLVDRNGDVWIATYKSGIDRYDPKAKTFTHYSAERYPQEVCDNLAWDLFMDKQGLIYCGTNSGLLSYSPVSHAFACARNTPDAIPFGALSSSCVARDGTIWFGGDKGLFRKDPDGTIRYFSTEDGLCNKDVNGIAEDAKGNIWIATGNGLSCYRTRENKFLNYGTEDGLSENEIQNVFSDGKKIYLNLYSGMVAFDPGALEIPVAYNGTYFSSVSFSGTEVMLRESNGNVSVNDLPYDRNDLSVSFTSPVFSSPGKVRYRFMLGGADNDWKLCGKEHAANYANLPPGSYTLLVQASDAGGNWVNEPVTLQFNILAPFWSTWWFRMLIVLAAVSLVYMFVRLRQRRKEQLEKVRTRIARDLHDDIGSTLSSINILSEMAKQKVKSDTEKAAQLVSTIGENSQSMLEKMDDIVWSIKPGNDQLSNIVARMREYASQTLEAKDIQYEFSIGEGVNHVTLPLGQRYDFFLVFKEAVNNMAKYSGTEKARVNLYRQNGSLLLEVEDEGTGFDPEKEQDGNGLRNMQKRAELLRARLEILSQKGKGTKVILKVPVS